MVVSAVVATVVASTAAAANAVVLATVNNVADDNLDRIDIGNSILRFGKTGMARSPYWTGPDGSGFEREAAIWRCGHDNVKAPKGAPSVDDLGFAGRFACARRAQVRCFRAMPMLIQLTPAQIKSTLRKMPST